MEKKLPVALQLFSVSDDMKNDFEGTLKKVKEMGYEGVEFAGLFGRDPKNVKAFCEEIGLVPVSIHLDLGMLLKHFDEAIKEAVDLGVKYVVAPFLPEKYRPGGEEGHLLIDGLKEIGKKVEALGMKFGYHNHNFEFETKVGDTCLFEYLIENVGLEHFNIEMDFGWLGIAQQDHLAYINKLAGSLGIVHLKDYYFPEIKPVEERDPNEIDFFDFRPMGYGELDIPMLLNALKDAGTEWIIIEQDDKSYKYPEWSKLDCVKKSIEYYKSL